MTLLPMLALSKLYEAPTVLSSASGHLRIYSQHAYKTVREAQTVPILTAEAMTLARFFPLSWHNTLDGPVLVALRSLLRDGSGQPSDARGREGALPLVLQAFPLVVPDAKAVERQQLLFDRTIADNPTDIGAPLLLPNGKLSRAALMRAKIAVALARSLPDTIALTRELHAANLLEPWPLRFDLGHGERVDIEDLLVLAPAALDDGAIHDLVSEFGPAAGIFLSLHRASLFRAGALLSAAKHAVARAKAPPPAAMSLDSLAAPQAG